jgi:hypothetical protein
LLHGRAGRELRSVIHIAVLFFDYFVSMNHSPPEVSAARSTRKADYVLCHKWCDRDAAVKAADGQA